MKNTRAVLLVCACLAIGVHRFLADLPDPYAPALDSYYYALQAESIKLFGQGFFRDSSPVAPIASALSAATGLPVLASLAALSGLFAASSAFGLGLCCLGLARIFSPKGRSPNANAEFASFAVALAVTITCAAGSAQSYLAREFLKNSMAQALFLLGLGTLLVAFAKQSETPRLKKHALQLVLSAFLFVSAGLTHRLYAGLWALGSIGAALAYACMLGLGGLRHKKRGPAPSAKRAQLIAIIASAATGIVLIGSLAAGIVERGLGGTAGFARAGIIARGSIPAAEKWEHAFAFLAMVLWIPRLAISIRTRSVAACVATGAMIAIHGACVLPITGFGWDLLSYRLMLAGIPFAAMAFYSTLAPLTFRVSGRFTAVALGACGVALAVAYAFLVTGPLETRRPSYGTAAADLGGISQAVPEGWSVLAPRGLAGFIWYELGVPSENFQPDAASPRSYARLAWGVGPAMFRDDDGPLGSRPLRFGPWTLVTEAAWLRLTDSRPNLLAVSDSRNELLSRPSDAPMPRYDLFDKPFPRKSLDANSR